MHITTWLWWTVHEFIFTILLLLVKLNRCHDISRSVKVRRWWRCEGSLYFYCCLCRLTRDIWIDKWFTSDVMRILTGNMTGQLWGEKVYFRKREQIDLKVICSWLPQSDRFANRKHKNKSFMQDMFKSWTLNVELLQKRLNANDWSWLKC